MKDYPKKCGRLLVGLSVMKIIQQEQQSPVADDVQALCAVVQPILHGLLYSTKKEIIKEVGALEDVKLLMLPRLYRPGDGDIGICFEYAVHSTIQRNDPKVMERVSDTMKLCKIKGNSHGSILFSAEKTGAQQIIVGVQDILTDNSSLLYGTQGRPVLLKKYLDRLASAFKNPRTRLALPHSISGLWKADLFLGTLDTDYWIGTTVKINPVHVEGAKGLRVGIVPTKQGNSDRIRKDDQKNLVICPLNHDADFMQIFYEGWQIVQAFLKADAKLPKEAILPRPTHREIARMLEDRREFPIVDVIEAFATFAQPHLLKTKSKTVDLQQIAGNSMTDSVIAPLAMSHKS